jgi:hypothetical protein
MFKPLNKLWNEYMNKLIKEERSREDIFQKILRGDLHGSEIMILNSRVTN